jgi:hypothetical protein
VIPNVSHNRIEGCAIKGFVAGAKLLEKVIIARVKGTKEELDHENLGNDNLALGHVINHAVKKQLENHDFLQLAHTVIEQGHEVSEGVGNGIRAAVLIKCTEHLEALPIIHRPFVFKEETQGTS